MLDTADRHWGNSFSSLKFTLLFLILVAVPLLMVGCATTGPKNTDPEDLPLLKKWNGDYPVSELGRLPEGQQDRVAGYIADSETFIPIWRAFMPKEILPSINFSKNIIVFTRNIQFYNRTSIFKVTLQAGTAQIIAMETMSAMPIEEKVAMAMAVIPREGVMTIQAGEEKIDVIPHK